MCTVDSRHFQNDISYRSDGRCQSIPVTDGKVVHNLSEKKVEYGAQSYQPSRAGIVPSCLRRLVIIVSVHRTSSLISGPEIAELPRIQNVKHGNHSRRSDDWSSIAPLKTKTSIIKVLGGIATVVDSTPFSGCSLRKKV